MSCLLPSLGSRLGSDTQPLLLFALASHSVAHPIFLIPLAETGEGGRA